MTRSAPEKRKYYFTFVTSVCLMNLMASTLTLTYSTYLTAYVVDELQWSKSSGAVLISTFWFFCTAGRFLGVLVVRWLSTELMLLGTIVSTVVFILPELIFAHLHPSVMWICTSGFGLSVATIYANSLTFGNMYVAFYGRIGALVVAAGSLGNAIGPSFIAPLFQSSGMKVFLVVLFVSALVMFFMFGLSWLVGKKLGKKSSLMYETMRENEPLLHSQKSNGKCETNNDEGKTDFETWKSEFLEKNKVHLCCAKFFSVHLNCSWNLSFACGKNTHNPSPENPNSHFWSLFEIALLSSQC